MEDNNHIDELFRTGLNQNFPVDENLWAQVESHLPAKSGRKGLWIFNLNSLALLAILSISMVLKSDTVEESQVSSESSLASEEKGFKQIESTELKTFDLEKVRNTPESEESIAISNPREINEAIIEPENKHAATESIATTKHSVKNKSVVGVNNLTKLSPDADQNQAEEAELGVLNFISGAELFPLNTNLNMHPIDKNNFWSATRKPYYYYELEVNKSLDLSKSISGLPTEVENYKTERESGGTNTNFGLNLLTDYKNFQFGVGIRYSRYTEGLRYTVDAAGIGYDISFDTTYSIVNGSFNSNGEPVLLIKREIERIETEKGITVKQNVLFRNEFERLQIPLMVGIHKNYGRFYGNLRASILLNYSIQQTGAYVGNDLNQINNFEASEQINQFTIGNGYAASLGYSLNEFVVVGTRFNYETDLTSFTKDYSSKFSQYGVGFWMMWRPR